MYKYEEKGFMILWKSRLGYLWSDVDYIKSFQFSFPLSTPLV